MACLRKQVLKHGYVYVVDFTVDGRRYIRSTRSSDLAVAKQILHDIQGRIARGKFDLTKYDRKEIMLAKFLDEFYAYARNVKKESTVKLHRFHTNTFLAFVGDRPLRSIQAHLLDQWKSERLGKVKPSTYNIEKRSLQAIFEIAKKWGYIEENPFASLRLVKVEERRLYLTREEIDRLFAVIDQDIAQARGRFHRTIHQLFRFYVEFLLNTGLRRDEALQLTKENVDLAQGVIFVERTKDKEARIIPLSRRARTILENLDDTLFSSLKRNTVTQKFTSAAKRAGLKGFKLHSIRHTFSTRLIELGVDILTVSKLLGHADIRTTMIYAKAGVTVLRSAVERLDEIESKELVRSDENRVKLLRKHAKGGDS